MLHNKSKKNRLDFVNPNQVADDINSFVILDLEWNSVYVKKIKGYLNEIIEIGAVKVKKSDNQFIIEDEFSIKIHPVFSRKLTKIVKNLTGLKEVDLEDGVPFLKSVSELRKWIGREPALVITWSNTDLLVLLENFKYFHACDFIPFLNYYADLQKYCQFVLNTGNSEQLGLSKASEMLEIDLEELETHRALDDSIIASKIFVKSYEKNVFNKFVKVSDDEFYKRLMFKSHFISSINDEYFNKNDLNFNCEKCEKTLSQKVKWFYKNHSFHAVLLCKSCEAVYNARVQTKITFDETVTKRKIRSYEKKPKGVDNDERKS